MAVTGPCYVDILFPMRVIIHYVTFELISAAKVRFECPRVRLQILGLR